MKISFTNQLRLIERHVGVKCTWQRGRRASQALIAAVLW
jgi:hypothetical protein